MKSKVLTLALTVLLLITPISFAQAETDCPTELVAYEELLAECNGPECPACEDCSWVALVKDRTFVSAVIGGVILLIGGIASIFIVPQ